MKKNHRYSSIAIKKLSMDNGRIRALQEKLGPVVVMSVDVAKSKMKAAIATRSGEVLELVHWTHPEETLDFIQLTKALRPANSTVEVLMEPTGSYGDALRHQCRIAGFEIIRLEARATHDARALFDGMNSMTDGKAATVLAKLRAMGLGASWIEREGIERTSRTALAERELFAATLDQHFGRLEAAVAKFWPELDNLFELRAHRSWTGLLLALPGPEAVAANPGKAKALLEKGGRRLLTPEFINEVIASAKATVGAPMDASEAGYLSTLVREIKHNQSEVDRIDRELKKTLGRQEGAAELVKVMGTITTAAMLGYAGDPRKYHSAKAFEKSLGLSLREKSSGEQQGKVHLSKRGPSIVRKYVYLWALRMIQQDPVVSAWYRQRTAFKTNAKPKAVAATARKLVRGIWHVARGARFDTMKLFSI